MLCLASACCSSPLRWYVGSWWGLAIVPPAILALAYRTLGEEKMLRAELDGYEAYARRVRWRYAPGLW